MRRLTDGLIGWMTFQRAAKRPLYSEALLYPAILEIAAGRGWDVFPQFKNPNNRRSSFDFCLLWKPSQKARYSRAALLEVKFVSQTTGRVGSLTTDIRKLKSVGSMNLASSTSLDSSQISNEISVKRYFILGGQTKHLHAVWALEEESEVKSEAIELWKAGVGSNGKPRRTSKGIRTDAGWLRHSPAFLRTDLTVMTFKETTSWNALPPET